MIFIFLFRVEPCCEGFSHYPSLWEVLFYFWERKKQVYCFILLYMHFIDNNYIVTDDAGSWWLVFVKAKMWFGSGRDYASMSSSSRSLNLLSVWFCPLILRSWFGVLTFDSNCIFACSFCFFSPTSSKDRWIKKRKKERKKKKKKDRNRFWLISLWNWNFCWCFLNVWPVILIFKVNFQSFFN